MCIQISLTCPHCGSSVIKRNGHNHMSKQNYLRKNCQVQFISPLDLTYNGCRSGLNKKIKLMLVRGLGIRDISVIENVSIGKVLSVLTDSKVLLKPKQTHYVCIEIDEFWTFVGSKEQKVWLIYAYHRKTGEIIAWDWGKRNLSTAKKLKKRLRELSITYDQVFTDNWISFIKTFCTDNLVIGKKNTIGIEGNNCRLRHRVRRAFRKTCCFSKNLLNHLKAFELAFFYINYGYV